MGSDGTKPTDKEDTSPADGGVVKFTAGPQLWAYLQWLSKHTILGKSPGEVAQQILVQHLSAMRGEDFKMPDKT